MTEFLRGIEERRRQVSLALDPVCQAELSQFFTPVTVAQHMASLLSSAEPYVSLLDAGAGVGILFAAAVEALCLRSTPPKRITILACEADPILGNFAQQTLDDCCRFAETFGIACTGEVICGDFLSLAAQLIQPNLLDVPKSLEIRPNIAILNPPYRKITSNSLERQTLRSLGIETTNLYTGFVATALRLLVPGGELVAITPRSFCNGSYFRPFREDLLQRAALTHLHLFQSRTETFRESAVLQETLIFRTQTGTVQPDQIAVAHLKDLKSRTESRRVAFSQIVKPDDIQRYFHIPDETTGRGLKFQMPLCETGLQVSTGRVVDFRATEFLRACPDFTTAPLIYPIHCQEATVCWPKLDAKKPNGLVVNEATKTLRVPNGNYVLVKRFSAKEQKRRIMAFVYESARFPKADKTGIGFENHLNYFHKNGEGMELALAHGLAAYLNSEEVDYYFRQFSGHTQVNATDLKNLYYPSCDELIAMGQSQRDDSA